MDFEPAYLGLIRTGELQERVIKAQAHMESCDLCARNCHINRLETERGAC
ncbi:MAG: hypothetical protein HQL69_04705 [Magnetococcales bacterium]|nr:hypothetical protein [Magnetococcales bacterium]